MLQPPLNLQELPNPANLPNRFPPPLLLRRQINPTPRHRNHRKTPLLQNHKHPKLRLRKRLRKPHRGRRRRPENNPLRRPSKITHLNHHLRIPNNLLSSLSPNLNYLLFLNRLRNPRSRLANRKRNIRFTRSP